MDLLQVKTLLETFKAAHDVARATERPDPGSVTRRAARRHEGTNDLLMGEVLRTNQLPERR